MTAAAARLWALSFALLAGGLNVVSQLWIHSWGLGIDSVPGSLAFWLVGYLVSVGLPLGAYYLLVGRQWRPPATWTVDAAGARFVAGPAVPRTGFFVVLLGWAAGNGLLTERVPGQDRMRVAEFSGALPSSIAFIGVPLLLALLLVFADRPRLVLDRDGVTLHRLLWRTERLGWAELLPGGPPAPTGRRPADLTVHRVGAAGPEPVDLPVNRLQIDAAFLAHTMRFYTDHPDRRPAVGTAAGLTQLAADAAR